jgi:hypothetical protein
MYENNGIKCITWWNNNAHSETVCSFPHYLLLRPLANRHHEIKIAWNYPGLDTRFRKKYINVIWSRWKINSIDINKKREKLWQKGNRKLGDMLCISRKMSKFCWNFRSPESNFTFKLLIILPINSCQYTVVGVLFLCHYWLSKSKIRSYSKTYRHVIW